MPERTDQPPEQPTPAAQILTAAADHLDRRYQLTHPITGRPVPTCMSDGLLDRALRTGLDAVLPKVPRYTDRAATRAAVQQALPPVAGTVDEYAAELRKSAVSA